MDKAQNEHLKKNKEIYEFVGSDGWKHVRDNLMDKVNDLQSIMNVTQGTPEEVKMDIAVRMATIELLTEWLSDVEGQSAQYEQNDLDPIRAEASHIMRQD